MFSLNHKTGWMMYNWLVTSLATGASIVLYDGSPILPHVDILWDMVDKIGFINFNLNILFV